MRSRQYISTRKGACSDDSNDDDMLSIAEIVDALTAASKPTGRLELVGFDACLMANFEVAPACCRERH
jgi:hypothetical protein